MRNHFKQHKKTVHGETVTCKVCSVVKPSQIFLDKHMKVHVNEVHICTICMSEFKNSLYLKTHIKRAHSDKPKATIFPCELCSFNKSQTEESLQNHILQIHSGLQYLCSSCPKSFQSPHTRRQHENFMHAEKTKECQECGKMFVSIGFLNAHIGKAHVVQKKDKICPQCGESFSVLESLKAHVLRHTNSRQFTCEVCAKAFLIYTHLEKHMGTHTLPFRCDQCNAKFSTKSMLNDHVNKKHEGIKSSCRFGCGWDAWHKRQCSNHEKSCLLNLLPGAPYTVAVGRASSLTLERYHLKLMQPQPEINEF